MNTTISKADRVIIFDTTLRDGEQWAGGAMTVGEKLQIAHGLAQARVDVIEAGFPVSSALDFRSVKLIAEEIEGSRIAALARSTDEDITCAANALIHCSRPRIHTFIATSSEHMQFKLRKTPDQVLKLIDHSVRFASQCMEGKGDVEWSAEDASRSSVDFLIQAVRVAIDAGATTINLPDTVGFVTPETYASMFQRIIAAVSPSPDIVFSAHVHNDRGLAVANSMAALAAGARQVECTIRGVGERAGNAQLEAVVLNLMLQDNPFICHINTQQLVPNAKLHASFIPDVSVMLPVVGANAFAHASGIHTDGMIKARAYEYTDPTLWGHEGGATFPLTRHSGMASVKSALNIYNFSLSQDDLQEFTGYFKEAAAEALESRLQRVIPHAEAVLLATTFLRHKAARPKLVLA